MLELQDIPQPCNFIMRLLVKRKGLRKKALIIDKGGIRQGFSRQDFPCVHLPIQLTERKQIQSQISFQGFILPKIPQAWRGKHSGCSIPMANSGLPICTRWKLAVKAMQAQQRLSKETIPGSKVRVYRTQCNRNQPRESNQCLYK